MLFKEHCAIECSSSFIETSCLILENVEYHLAA